MKRICTEHQNAHADAAARVNVSTALAMRFSWITTKPYGNQRPSGVAPS